MTSWEKKIIDAFISHYFASAPETEDDRKTLRIRSSVFFPNFDRAHPDEKESYLEAAESLERKGIVTLRWEKRDKGERLKTISCETFEKFFAEAGRPYPKTEAEKIRAMLAAKVSCLKETLPAVNGKTTEAEKTLAFLEFFSLHFGPGEIGHGIDQHTMEEFIRLLEFLFEPARLERITTRALSILLYRDSKRLEYLLALFAPLLSRAQKTSPCPDITFLERSYPETMIAGKIFFTFKDNAVDPIFSNAGDILGFPLETIEKFDGIGIMNGQAPLTVLTIENKETFYALASPQKSGAGIKGGTDDALSRFTCFLYVGGYSNSAATALIKMLARAGFTFYHAGDLDPDGILILQHIADIADRPVTPLRMDAAAFDQYRVWARPLTKPMLRQIEKIREETRAVPELAGLLRRIEETGMGVEQEIIDYR